MEGGRPDDIGLTGQMRLARIEAQLDRMNDKMDDAARAAREAAAAATDLRGELAEAKARIRALELRFYGILAGLVTAVALLVYNGRAT